MLNLYFYSGHQAELLTGRHGVCSGPAQALRDPAPHVSGPPSLPAALLGGASQMLPGAEIAMLPNRRAQPMVSPSTVKEPGFCGRHEADSRAGSMEKEYL